MGDNVIELNGKRYDAITGEYLGKNHVVPKHITRQFARGKTIDGFVRPAARPKPAAPAIASKPEPRPKPAASEAAKPAEPAKPAKPVAVKAEEKTKKTAPADSRKPATAPAPEIRKPAPGASNPAKREHHQPVQARHRKPERSKTLMRRVTKKPEIPQKPRLKPHAPAEVAAKPAASIAPKHSVYGVDPRREIRASIIGKHHAIRRFHPDETPKSRLYTVDKQVQAVPVKPLPLHLATPKTPASPHSDILDKALARASSHEQPAHKVRRRTTKRRKLVNSLAIVAAFLIIGGFITYLNLPQIQLKVASVQAGFGAAMPDYVPAGYALENGVQRSGGTVTLSFRSGDSRFRINQQSSDWNSQTLLDSTLALGGDYKTVQKNGQTIYIYGNNTSAAWVNGGVRYDLTGNAHLTENDIVSIATSM